MSQGNQSIDFNGKYQYLIIDTYYTDKEWICGAYDTLKALKSGLTNISHNYYSDGQRYKIKKIYIKPEIVDMNNEDISQIQKHVDELNKIKIKINVDISIK